MSMHTRPQPPENQEQLLLRAQRISGSSLGELACLAKWTVPPDLKKDKGWVGLLLEYYLGARAGSKAEQDFADIGVELKTIPVDVKGQPLETTFVCYAPLTRNTGIIWENSHLRKKLAKVLWVPIEGERQIPLTQRRVGTPFFWSPNLDEDKALQQDWEELMERIIMGQINHISAHHGEVLQLRPKAKNSRILTAATGETGQPIMTLPRGFYLKKTFTAAILARYFLL
ncbi:DNA mismatch repair endonuclease MutH [Candidatus Hamiltonella defensa]|uniref:DNA mismatch repair protein MutH n=2 Tax=Candidatus Williamhamiltonella defendens TaxID=138072 RepID=C4K7F1_HAMD5|nr:DNA mismatch repair endonuclease MutH [Candidatus Hamiltonella defensa]ACQ68494.1 putative methyl-directed mismatch repair protein with restriction endonuclease-like domain [Candidatus Hamiltonella defensa 5AT (Acyrthosiphon pisum)]ASV33640.1 DNA mismatch repair endonuclease MutH [Candidatus Hamiltonella defensa]ATW23039.1 DNA mismatch repair endonuclease MutH [Candidatus Hamiltonella defensa]AWK16594.1 DNA mismatch repair protein MutH [Candidatus Hamiltonella defensa]MBK4360862.1 DNA misma